MDISSPSVKNYIISGQTLGKQFKQLHEVLTFASDHGDD